MVPLKDVSRSAREFRGGDEADRRFVVLLQDGWCVLRAPQAGCKFSKKYDIKRESR